MYPAHGPSSVLSRKTKTDINGKGGPCDRREEGCVTSYAGSKMTSVREEERGHAWRVTTEAAFRCKVF